MSDAEYAEGLTLQETIMSSLTTLQAFASEKSSREIGESSEKVSRQIEKNSRGIGESSEKNSREIRETSEKNSGEIGDSSQHICEICAESKNNDEMFPVENCSHKFCTQCISRHISIEIQKGHIVNHENKLPCPGLDCKGLLDIDTCRKIVPRDVLSTWDEIICESMILPWQKFYCPYKSCSVLLVKDSDEEVIGEAECPLCRRLFCVECKVPWHSGIGCEEFSTMNENERGSDDLMVHELAKRNGWQRCPSCKFYVEKNEGCLHMTCRCGFEFCYACGETWSFTHGGCQ
ncbi:hypothetical protein DH2020_013483 [Rehmannia glutinosa]|uniref:RBR-type E3 ubiquitin transferase n=1 Tax=Rehmannia glutinosa TaxID=99300 RepID=A0ABR0X5R6_REHGL